MPLLGYGAFITQAVSFAILAFIIFLLVRVANKAFQRAVDAADPADVVLLREIRDELRKRP